MLKDFKEFPVKVYRHFMHDSLYRNSIFLIINTIATSIIGFVFWTIAARMYDPAQVGIASALIAASGFLASLSYLGFDYSLIKYIPKAKNISVRLGTAFTITGLMSVVVAAMYLLLTPYLFDSFAFLVSSFVYILFFVTLIIMTTWNGITNSVLLAFKVAKYIAAATAIAGIFKILLVVILNNYEKDGLLLAHLIAIIASVILNFIFIAKVSGYAYKPIISKSEITATAKFSAANYSAAIAGGFPLVLLPILIVHYLGPEQAAYFYIVTMVVALLNVISQATTQSLFAHGSWNDYNLTQQTRKAFVTIMVILIPSIILVILIGRFGLSIFGEDYSKYGYMLLVILSLSTLPKVASQLSATKLRIENRTKPIIITVATTTIITISLSVIFLGDGLNLSYIGLAVLAGELASAIIYILINLNFIKIKM